ncbi:MAG: transcription-repair coupling factor, partial [Thermocrispum sp.]
MLDGLLSAALSTPAIRAVVDRAGAPELAVQGPSSARQLVTGALAAAGRPVLAVVATGRDVEQLTVALSDLLGPDASEDTAAVVAFPSWETLPHERLSPRADTVGTRLEVLRRLRHPDRGTGHGRPQVVVTGVRSLIQPMAPGLADLVPVDLTPGSEHDFGGLATRLVELAYSRVDMVEKRGEFAVRGGILDVFPPTAPHPYRVEFWGDEVSEIRMFAVADQRSLPETVERVYAPPCRELLLTPEVRERAAALRREDGAPPGGWARGGAEGGRDTAALSEMLEKLAQGIPVEGMEALIPVLLDGGSGTALELLTDALPDGAHVVVADPERVRTRAHDLVRTGQEFLEASWSSAAGGGQAPIDLGASAYRALDEVERHAKAAGCCWWTLSQLTTDAVDVLDTGVVAAPGYRGDFLQVAKDLRAHTASGGAGVLVVAGAGTAARAVEQLAAEDVPATQTESLDEPPAAGVVTVTRGTITEGFALPSAAIAVLS